MICIATAGKTVKEGTRTTQVTVVYEFNAFLETAHKYYSLNIFFIRPADFTRTDNSKRQQTIQEVDASEPLGDFNLLEKPSASAT